METTEKGPQPSHAHATLWRQALLRLLPGLVAAVVGIVIASSYGPIKQGSVNERLLSLFGVVIFASFAIMVLYSVTRTMQHILADSRLRVGHTAILRFAVRTIGYVAIFLETLSLLGVPVGSLVIGGAALGIVLGVAAQQALSNIFASFVLVIARPFVTGDDVTINAGGFGREYSGRLLDIGLTHTRLKEKDGNVVLLPNSALLQWAAISPYKNKTKETKERG